MKVKSRILTSTINALKGVRKAFWSDGSFQFEVVVGIAFYSSFICSLWPLRGVELLFLLMSYVLILTTELINTSIEVLLDRLHPLRHGLIGTSKDIAAGAVLIAVFFAAVVAIVIVLSRLGCIVM